MTIISIPNDFKIEREGSDKKVHISTESTPYLDPIRQNRGTVYADVEFLVSMPKATSKERDLAGKINTILQNRGLKANGETESILLSRALIELIEGNMAPDLKVEVRYAKHGGTIASLGLSADCYNV